MDDPKNHYSIDDGSRKKPHTLERARSRRRPNMEILCRDLRCRQFRPIIGQENSISASEHEIALLMHLRSLDLNLLTVFDTMYREGNQKRAAEKLGMSQPAVSNAISRLRDVLGDPLFIRTVDGMHPTSVADRLSGPIREALETISQSVQAAQQDADIHLASSHRTIVFVSEEIGELVILPNLAEMLVDTAPNMRIRARRHSRGLNLASKLADGSIDIAIQFDEPADASLRSTLLLEDELVTLVRRDHPRVHDTLTLDAFLAETHVIFGRLGHAGTRKTVIDSALKRLSLERRICFETFSVQTMPVVVSTSDMICTVPRRIAKVFAEPFRLQVLKTPLDLPGMRLHMVWSRTVDKDPIHTSAREALVQIANSV